MDILNQIKTVLNQINADGVNEQRLDALAEALSKLDAVSADTAEAMRAKMLLLSEQNKELRTAAQSASAAPDASAKKAVKVKWRGERYDVPTTGGTILKDEKGRTAVAYASKDEARRAVHAALHPETTLLGMLDPQAAEAAFLARRRETDGALSEMKARREATYPSGKKKWYKYAGVALAGAAAVGLGYVAAEEASSRWEAHKAGKKAKT